MTEKHKNELICCQMIIGGPCDPLRPNSDFSNLMTVYVNENTMEVYDGYDRYLGIAEREAGSQMFKIKLND